MIAYDILVAAGALFGTDCLHLKTFEKSQTCSLIACVTWATCFVLVVSDYLYLLTAMDSASSDSKNDRKHSWPIQDSVQMSLR